MIDTAKLSRFSFKVGKYRPPSEGAAASLLIQVTENCPWNRCAFCCLYRNHKFVYRPVAEVKKDIDQVKAVCDEIKKISSQLGRGGRVTPEVIAALRKNDPSLSLNPGFITIVHWLYTGGKTAFLQDSNSLIMRPPELIDLVKYLRKAFPSIERVTSYARSHTLYHKKLEDLKAIRAAGLDRLHVGLETGDDQLLQKIKKGVTADQHIQAGLKAKEAGFELSEYFMTDLGGRNRWRPHALNTARVLSEINPHYVRSRPLVPICGTPLFEEYAAGALRLSSPHERLHELRLMVQNLNFSGRLVFDHSMNSWCNQNRRPLFSLDHEGYQFPQQKDKVIELIELGLGLEESRHIHVEELIKYSTL